MHPVHLGAFTNGGNTARLLGSDQGCCAFKNPRLLRVRSALPPTVNAPGVARARSPILSPANFASRYRECATWRWC